MSVMYKYVICNRADTDLFKKQCLALEKNIINLKTESSYEDVDGTEVKKYVHQNGTVEVRNDAKVDVLLVMADFDLTPYFKNT